MMSERADVPTTEIDRLALSAQMERENPVRIGGHPQECNEPIRKEQEREEK